MHDGVRTRRVGFDFAPGSVPHHYVGGDLLASHLVTLASATFPEGEEFFVRSVRKVRDRVDDPELAHKVSGFIGQEAMHGRAHADFNTALGRIGYPTRFVDWFVRVYLGVLERVLPTKIQLAITAALEHYTASFAAVFLTDPEVQAQFDDDEIRALWQWHALEETEHKAVAFDVFQQVSGNNKLRVRVMRFVTIDIVIGAVLGMVISLLRDRSAYSPRRLRESWRELRDSPFARSDFVERLRDYNRLDFHPDDHDTTALVGEWRERLFEGDGHLAGRVRGAA